MKTTVTLLLFNFALLNAQNTLQLAEDQTPPEASIQEVAWMEGHWKGNAFGGEIEEIWSPIAGKSMMFVFRLLVDDEVNFYEIGHIKEQEGTLVFELKHFSAQLHAWEEKEEVQQFKHVKTQGNRVYFDGFTFEKVSANEINIYGRIGNDDGTATETVFNYKREP